MDLNTNPNPILNDRWIKWASFWVNNRAFLGRVLVFFVAALEGVLLLYSAYFALDIFVLSRERDRMQQVQLSQGFNAAVLHRAIAPRPIETQAAVVLPGSNKDGAFDVLVKLVNPNKNWVAKVTYQFGDSEQGSVLILNDQERFVLGHGVASASAGPALKIIDIDWERLREVAVFNERKPRFVVSDVSFIPARQVIRSSTALAPSQISFAATNESIFGFWQVGFTVVLLQNDAPLAAQRVVLDKFLAAEQREVLLNVFTSVPSVTDVLVVPDVNVLEQSNFIFEEGPLITF